MPIPPVTVRTYSATFLMWSITHRLIHIFVSVKNNPFYGLADDRLARIRFHPAGNHLHQRRFSATVRSDDADAVILQEDIGKIIDRRRSRRLMKMVCLDRGSSETAGNRAHLHFICWRFIALQRSALNTPFCFVLRACAPRRIHASSVRRIFLAFAPAHRHRLALCL